MKITHVNNAIFDQIAVFVTADAQQTLESDAEKKLTTSIDLPICNNSTDFGNAKFACVRYTSEIHNAVRFWQDSDGVVWHLAHPNLDSYDLKKEVPMIKQKNDSRVNFRLHAIRSGDDYATRQIGIVGEMVVDIVLGD